MVQLDYIEQTGHGVPLIVSRYGREVFDITENFITVTLPLNRQDKGERYSAGKSYFLEERHFPGKRRSMEEKPSMEERRSMEERPSMEKEPPMKEMPPMRERNSAEAYLLQPEGQFLDEFDQRILWLMGETGQITVAEISRQAGLGTTSVTKRIRRLKEVGIIERRGSRKKGLWIIKEAQAKGEQRNEQGTT